MKTEIKTSCDNAIKAVRFFSADAKKAAVSAFVSDTSNNDARAAYLNRVLRSPRSESSTISAAAYLLSMIGAM